MNFWRFTAVMSLKRPKRTSGLIAFALFQTLECPEPVADTSLLLSRAYEN